MVCTPDTHAPAHTHHIHTHVPTCTGHQKTLIDTPLCLEVFLIKCLPLARCCVVTCHPPSGAISQVGGGRGLPGTGRRATDNNEAGPAKPQATTYNTLQVFTPVHAILSGGGRLSPKDIVRVASVLPSEILALIASNRVIFHFQQPLQLSRRVFLGVITQEAPSLPREVPKVVPTKRRRQRGRCRGFEELRVQPKCRCVPFGQ